MGKRRNFAGNFYHVYNRGVDKRMIFKDEKDLDRFMLSMKEFNQEFPIGSIHKNSFNRTNKIPGNPLVEFIAYAVLPNHYHFLMYAYNDQSISKLMQKFSTAYTMYFNKKYKRSGALFQGRHKIKHVDDNEYLYHVAAYINHNDKVHDLSGRTSKFVKTSLAEYLGRPGLAKPVPHFFEKIPVNYNQDSLVRVNKTIKERKIRSSLHRKEYKGIADYLHE